MADAEQWTNGHRKALQAAEAGALTYTAIARAVGREYQTIRLWRIADPDWAAALDAAIESGYDTLRERALESVIGALDKANKDSDWRPCDIDNAHKVLAQLDPARWRDRKEQILQHVGEVRHTIVNG